jgi:MFS family permease
MRPGATLLHLRGAAGMDAIYRKISWRLLPLLMLCCMVAWLNRVNIGFVQQHMGDSLAFRDQVHSWGMAVFFIGYGVYAVPCNLLLEHLGARKTLLRMMLGWAAFSAASAFVRSPFEFYLIRFLLGVFEAGFIPGVILYLTYWFPSPRRARAMAVFFASTLAAAMLAAPLSATMLAALAALAVFDPWQWLLLAQAAPAALLGVFAWFYLDDRPGDADWLSGFEQQMVAQDLARDEARRHGGSEKDEDEDHDAPAALAVLWTLLRDRAMLLLALASVLLGGAGYALAHWSPALLQRWTATASDQLTLLSAVPALAGIAGMVALAHDSDRRRERRGHFIASTVLAAGGLALVVAADNALAWSLAGLALATIGIGATTPLLLAILTDLLTRGQTATGIGFIVSAGVLGGAFGPALGARVLAWGDSPALLAALAGAYVGAGALVLLALRLAAQRGAAAARQGPGDQVARN